MLWASAYAAHAQTSLYVAHIIDSLGDDELWTALFETPDEIERRVLHHATEEATQFARETLTGPTPDERHVLVAVGSPADEIDRFAGQKEVELVVAGTSGHGRLHHAFFGSTAFRLTHHLDRPLVFVPEGATPPPAKKIVIAVDFSPCSDAAMKWAADRALEWGSQVIAVHGLGASALAPDFEPTASFLPMLDALSEQREQQIRASLDNLGVEQARVIISRSAPADAILETTSEEDADFLVLGTHGRGAVGRFFLGSVALRALRSTKCATAVIHAPTAE